MNFETLFDAVDAAPPIDAVEVVAAALAREVDAHEVSFLIADFSGKSLVRLSHTPYKRGQAALGRERSEKVPLDGSPQGQAIVEQRLIHRLDDGIHWIFVPVSSRGEAVGVLEMSMAHPLDAAASESIRVAAHVLAYVLIANRRYTDVFEWGQRSLPLSLEAEIQHRLLPGSYTCEAREFVLAGWLEPAGNVGGNTFDFSVARDLVHLSITDAMGHDLASSLLATVFVGSLRNSRRRGDSLLEQARIADAALTAYTRGDAFVTGQLVRVNLASGTASMVNAGHPPPVLLRNGRAENLELLADAPFGLHKRRAYRVQEFRFAPGDRMVFLTDGLQERNAASVDVLEVLLSTRHLHPRQAIQEVTRAVLAACGGQLKDDATALCFDWLDGTGR